MVITIAQSCALRHCADELSAVHLKIAIFDTSGHGHMFGCTVGAIVGHVFHLH